jgi:hypothetical protein
MTAITYINDREIVPLCAVSTNTSIQFNKFRADLSDGYSQQALYGADTGLKNWSVNYKLQGASGTAAIEKDGASYTPEQYLWDLYCRNQRTGEAFIIRNSRNDQYYLAEFADEKLTYERLFAKYYSAGVNFRQKRIPGVTVFDPMKLPFWGLFRNAGTDLTNSGWTDSINSRLLETTAFGVSNYTTVPNAQNGLTVARFHPAGVLGDYLLYDGEVNIKQLFIVLKYRGATFSNFAGVVSGADSETPVLVGSSGTTKFYDFGFSATQKYSYEKNSVSYPESNQQAPMNVFGLVYIEAREGISLSQLRIAIDGADVTRFGKVDIGEMAFAVDAPILDSDAREYIEHLQTKWNY